MTDYHKIDSYLEQNLDQSLAELSRLVAQPSVGAQNLGMKECAALVGKMLKARGFDVQVMETPGAPVVFGERKGKSDKTMLIYNHYDVQPPEPLELWETPPFEPSLRDGKLYGRGVSDALRLHAPGSGIWLFLEPQDRIVKRPFFAVPEGFAVGEAAPLVGKALVEAPHEGLEGQERIAGLRRFT